MINFKSVTDGYTRPLASFKMTSIKFLILITLLFSFSSFGQGLIDKYPEIKKEKIKIDQSDSLRTITIENEDFLENMTDGGGKLKGFYNTQKIIRKIEVIVYLSYGIQEYDFYLKNETPILIQDRFRQFAWDEESDSFDSNHFDVAFNGTYIFQNSHLVDLISLGHNRFEDDQIDIEETFMSEFETYLKKIKKRLANKVYKK